jgi:hypothetical protein
VYAQQWFAFADIPLMCSDPHMGRFIQKLGGKMLEGGG